MLHRREGRTPGLPYRVELAGFDEPFPFAHPPQVHVVHEEVPTCTRCGSVSWDFDSDVMARCECGHFWFVP